MYGMELCFDWDDRDVQKMIQAAVKRGEDLSPVMADFSEHMVHETIEHFEKEEDPQGQGWQKLSEVTEDLREKAGKSGNILQVDGRLKGSISNSNNSWDKTSVTVTAGVAATNLEYAAIHNFGGMAGRGRKVKIPQRQFLGFNDDDIEYFTDSVARWIVTKKVG